MSNLVEVTSNSSPVKKTVHPAAESAPVYSILKSLWSATPTIGTCSCKPLRKGVESFLQS
eukprot:14216361-Ditylum_brightwellii.AAC.1